MDLVEQGAREARLTAALLAPFITRGAFVATFMNTYAALPMALTGALSGARAAHRVNETSSFFAVTTQPGALERHGPGFRAAAMVRLMHSMVRVHALTRSQRWDPAVFGVPVPQSDQLPANYIVTYLLARKVLRAGRDFTPAERAVVEFTRYRGFLLGMPEELLPIGPEEIVRVLHTWGAVLRGGFDDATCGELVRSTMSAHLRSGNGLLDRIADDVEKSWSKTFFVRAFAAGDKEVARSMGVDYGLGDTARIAVTTPFIVGRHAAVGALRKLPLFADPLDRYLVAMVERRLREYGKPEFTSDHTSYADRQAPERRARTHI
nr:oxygenase MpaB family protein [Nocardioides alcanivorans]